MNQSFWTQAYENLKRPRSKFALSYDANRKPHQYSVGDTVVYRLYVVSSKAQNISAKLAMRWSRPVLIAKVVGPNSVLLANPDTGVVVRRAHVSQLKPFVLYDCVVISTDCACLFCDQCIPSRGADIARTMAVLPSLVPGASAAEDLICQRWKSDQLALATDDTPSPFLRLGPS